MKWLSKLILGSETAQAPRYGAAQEEPDPIDWKLIEDRLVVLAEQHIQDFAASHTAESFYGFGLDCTSEEGQILLCLNTRDAQTKSARASLARRPELYAGQSESDVVRSIEWGFGDWKYQGFNARMRSWSKGWRDVEALVQDAMAMLTINRKHAAASDLREAFMTMACSALRRLERSPAINALHCDPDFRVLCTDHDEGPEEGFARMATLNEGTT